MVDSNGSDERLDLDHETHEEPDDLSSLPRRREEQRLDESFKERLRQARLKCKDCEGEISQPDVLTFGKHKGKTFQEVWQGNREYCKWCLSHLNCSQDNQYDWLDFVASKVLEESKEWTEGFQPIDVKTSDLEQRVESLEARMGQLENQMKAVMAVKIMSPGTED